MDRVLVRSMLLRLSFVVVFVLVATAMSLPSARAQAGERKVEPARIAGALYTPTRTDAGITWDARWTLSLDAQAELVDGSPRALLFAVPLPDGETLDPAPGLTPLVEDGGRIVGVRFTGEALQGRVLRATLRQPIPRARNTENVPLGAPIAAGTALQILDADLGGGTRFEVGATTILERNVGNMSPPGVGLAQRQEARRLTGYDEIVTGAAIYVRGDDVKNAGGLTASVVTPDARGHHGVLAIAGGFAGIVVALVLAGKKLRDRASVERADALLAAEFERADHAHRSRFAGNER